MKKSGLADSPFFVMPQKKNETAITPPFSAEPVAPTAKETINAISDSPTPNRTDVARPKSQNEENQDQKRSNDRTFERTDERSNERLNERSHKQKREKIRHTFDIYRDQLIALQMIQLEKVQAGKKKPKLGKMVSEGIDLFIRQEAFKKKRT